MEPQFEIALSENFPLEIGNSPKKVQNAYPRVQNRLREHPDTPDNDIIKALKGYKHLWRYKVAKEYRLVYRVERNEKSVILMMIGHRKEIYDRLGLDENGKPSARIVVHASELLEREPSVGERGTAIITLASEQSASDNSHSNDKPLPESITSGKLELWGIPSQYHQQLISIETEGELLGIRNVPSQYLEKILNGIYPPKIEEVIQKPIRLSSNGTDLINSAGGKRSLESFLLKLDEEQKNFVSRFRERFPKGPWLLKGGPGSGKTVIALYCIHSLIKSREEELDFSGRPLRILFTTYTNSLVNASKHLLNELEIKTKGARHILDVITVDKCARRYCPDTFKKMSPLSGKGLSTLMTNIIAKSTQSQTSFSFSKKDVDFLIEEIEWVILGQGLNTVEDYLKADRSGRGRALGQIQKRQIWDIFNLSQKELHKNGNTLYSEVLYQASQNNRPEYDFVFIDEAQDLKPVAIRFCIGLCKNPKNVFITADVNQSIYGHGLSWNRVAEDLKFQGRAKILRRTYRSTKEVWEAISDFAPKGEQADSETIASETVYNGPIPIIAQYSEIEDIKERLNSFLHESLLQERVTPKSAVVLCPTYRGKMAVFPLIDPKFNPKNMSSREVDLNHPGVKVMTIHAAKGLQFPVVILAGVENGTLPSSVRNDTDSIEHNAQQLRILFVACSRAMRRLMIFASRKKPSPFLKSINDVNWEIEDL